MLYMYWFERVRERGEKEREESEERREGGEEREGGERGE